MRRFNKPIVTGSVLATTLLPGLALAHEGHTHASGFAAGLAHPLGGLDHLLAMVAVGFWAAHLGGNARWQLPWCLWSPWCWAGPWAWRASRAVVVTGYRADDTGIVRRNWPGAGGKRQTECNRCGNALRQLRCLPWTGTWQRNACGKLSHGVCDRLRTGNGRLAWHWSGIRAYCPCVAWTASLGWRVNSPIWYGAESELVMHITRSRQ